MKKQLLLMLSAAAMSVSATAADVNVQLPNARIQAPASFQAVKAIGAEQAMQVENAFSAQRARKVVTSVPGTYYLRPEGSFWMTISKQGYTFSSQSGRPWNWLQVGAYNDFTFANVSDQATTNTWNYYDVESNQLTSNDVDLTVNYAGYFQGYTPMLTGANELGDSTYATTTFMQTAGSVPEGQDEGDYLGISNMNFAEGTLLYNPTQTMSNNSESNYYLKAWLNNWEGYRVDTCYVQGYAEFFQKPQQPYLVTDITSYVRHRTAGEVIMEIYKVVPTTTPNGSPTYELGDLISSSSYTMPRPSQNDDLCVLEFSNLTAMGDDGIESDLLIDDAVLVLFRAGDNSVRFEPMMYYTDNLPNRDTEKNFYQYVNVTDSMGESYPVLFDHNMDYRNDGSIYVSASFTMMNAAFYYLVSEGNDYRYNAPAEGGSKEFNVNSMYSSSAWQAVTVDGDDVPEWITIEAEDGTVQQDGQTYYSGETKLTFTVEALPEGMESRSCDIEISYTGAKAVFHIGQGEADVLPGDVNGDGIVDASDVTTLVKVVLGEIEATAGADVNGDGVYDASDVTALIAIILG